MTRAALMAHLLAALDGQPDAAVAELLDVARLLCPKCGARATRRSSSAVGSSRQVYLRCACGWRGTRVMYPYNGSDSRHPGAPTKMGLYGRSTRTRTPSETRSMLIPARRPTSSKWEIIEAAICITGKLDDIEKHYSEQTLHAALAQWRYGISLKDLLLTAATENGHHDVGLNGGDRLFTAAFRPNPIIRAAGFSASDLTDLLSNVANKFLLSGFNAVEKGWRDVAAVRNVADFKQYEAFAITGDCTYEKVGPTAEIKHGSLGSESYTGQAETYARMLTIDRRSIINDDLGALTDAPKRLGRGAALALNKIFWTAFLGGVGSFWAAGNNNLITGGGSALSLAGLGSATTKFRQQTDPDGEPLGATPRILLVPPELEITATSLINSTLIVAGGGSTDGTIPNANPFVNKFKIVAASYLSNSNYTGYSTTAWWLLADPADLITIEVAFLRGIETPTIESAQADFNSMGISMRGYHDFGVAMFEPRASVRAAGA